MKQDRFDDFEEGLSHWIGDFAASRIGEAVRGLAGWGERTARTAVENVREYLQEERRDLVARAEMEAFSERVAEVSAAVEALEQRIRDLTAARS